MVEVGWMKLWTLAQSRAKTRILFIVTVRDAVIRIMSSHTSMNAILITSREF